MGWGKGGREKKKKGDVAREQFLRAKKLPPIARRCRSSEKECSPREKGGNASFQKRVETYGLLIPVAVKESREVGGNRSTWVIEQRNRSQRKKETSGTGEMMNASTTAGGNKNHFAFA